jgi:hypothetical protein
MYDLLAISFSRFLFLTISASSMSTSSDSRQVSPNAAVRKACSICGEISWPEVLA